MVLSKNSERFSSEIAQIKSLVQDQVGQRGEAIESLTCSDGAIQASIARYKTGGD